MVRRDTSHHIIDAAIKVFSQYGFEDTLMDQIAHEACVGKQTIYNYYSNKNELYQSVIDEASIRHGRLLGAFDFKSGSARTSLQDFSRFFVLSYHECFPGHLASGDRSHSRGTANLGRIKAVRGQIISGLELLLLRGREEGVFNQRVEAEFLLSLLGFLVDGCISSRTTMRKYLPIAAEVDDDIAYWADGFAETCDALVTKRFPPL